MRLPPRWLRRVVIDPLWVPLALAFVLIFAVVAALSAVLIPITPRRRVLRLSVLAGSYLVLDLGMLLGCTYLWCRHPWHRDAKRWTTSHVSLLRWTLRQLLAVSKRTLGFELEISPDASADEPQLPLEDRDPVLVLARHAGPGDSFSLVWLIIERYERCPRVVLKGALQWDPGLDLVLNRLSSCFLPSRSGAGDDATELIKHAALGLRGRDALLIFPEGGNWTPHRHRRAVKRLRRSGYGRAARAAEARPHVLPPRPAGTVACLVARPDLDVVVIAHSGLDDLVSPAAMWRALPLVARPMTTRAWRERAATVPRAPDDIYDWLDAQWQRVEHWVAAEAAPIRSAATDSVPEA
jgi:1-acyl-sn-glycerol-3-phosphate acyltransferase